MSIWGFIKGTAKFTKDTVCFMGKTAAATIEAAADAATLVNEVAESLEKETRLARRQAERSARQSRTELNKKMLEMSRAKEETTN